MRVIIAGSRGIRDYEFLKKSVVESGFDVKTVVSGAAKGVDKLGEHWAEQHGIPVMRFPAQWGMYGKSAGFRRNREMAAYADALIAVWDGSSRGTQHMIQAMRRIGKPVFVALLDEL